jgi:DNA polymerase (family 10)
MPRRVARTDPPSDAADLETEDPPTRSDELDLAPADADLREEEDPRRGDLTNGDLARIFHDIGDMLEVKGELRFKTVAYHRAADAIGRSPVDLVAAYRSGDPPKIPGVGAAISDKITELVTTGRMAYYDKLIAEVPPTLVELLRIPGLGPRTVRQIWVELGIVSIDDLRIAAEGGRIRTLKGLSDRTEALILDGIRRLETTPQRMLLNKAEATILGFIEALTDTPGVSTIEPAGSFRRKRETIGDLDLLAETDDGPGLIERFTGLGIVDQVLNKGGYKAAVRVMRGPQVDLMVMPPGAAGTYRVHFTGSKEHNVRLRERARDMGWSLSEKGFLRIGEDGEPLTGDDAELRTFPTEEEAYAFLSSNLSCARTRVRSRPRSPAACRPSSGSRTSPATCTVTPSGPTAPTRSRSWPRRLAGVGTPSRS